MTESIAKAVNTAMSGGVNLLEKTAEMAKEHLHTVPHGCPTGACACTATTRGGTCGCTPICVCHGGNKPATIEEKKCTCEPGQCKCADCGNECKCGASKAKATDTQHTKECKCTPGKECTCTREANCGCFE
ncbi:hypothetical protein HDV00_007812 [Rhizophlyctis rosea]|nr:hypothetical protein HDV00_007812 [Rhizophlyctis rosea]